MRQIIQQILRLPNIIAIQRENNKEKLQIKNQNIFFLKFQNNKKRLILKKNIKFIQIWKEQQKKRIIVNFQRKDRYEIEWSLLPIYVTQLLTIYKSDQYSKEEIEIYRILSLIGIIYSQIKNQKNIDSIKRKMVKILKQNYKKIKDLKLIILVDFFRCWIMEQIVQVYQEQN
ncbi:unnamed protein product [Paramecium sonneborni]|uniref:Uncharacterized protein n=1 Tax=Paramecium sonneborni TaxID=65129 RepID=A0A8S1N150_9CILI|nr:unnamed protein product [Paramecium sonneborni]